jgi:O-antigen ligase
MTTFFDTTRRTLAILIGFFIPISTALTNILCPLALLLILAEAQYKQKFNVLRHHPVAVVATLLFVFMLFAMLYSSVSWLEAIQMADKYRELLYISLFILIFRDKKSRVWGLYAFLSAMGITLFLSYLMAITGWQIGKGEAQNAFVFKDYITQSILMALAAYFVAVQGWHERRWLWLRGIVFLLAIYNIIFLSEGRSGYLVLFCLILLFSYQIYRIRGFIIGSLLLAILSVLAYQSSDVLRQRMDRISQGVENYQQGKIITSVELRLEFYRNSLALIEQKPIFGHGTGSFSHEYRKLIEKQSTTMTTNPHNEYLMIAVQWGLIGVALFLYLLYVIWRTAIYHLTEQQRAQAQGLLVTILVGGLVNSLWLDNTEGHIFAYLIGIFYGGLNLTSAQTSRFPNNVISDISAYRKPIIASLVLIILALMSYQTFIVLNDDSIDESVALTMKEAIINWDSIESSHENNHLTAIGFVDSQKVTTAIDTQFQSSLKKANDGDNALTVKVMENVTISTQIQIEPRHVGKKARLIFIAAYYPPNEAPALLFQRSGEVWEAFDGIRLKSAHDYSQLPEKVDVLIYQGPVVVAAGQVRIFVAYVLYDNKLVLNAVPLQFVVVDN